MKNLIVALVTVAGLQASAGTTVSDTEAATAVPVGTTVHFSQNLVVPAYSIALALKAQNEKGEAVECSLNYASATSNRVIKAGRKAEVVQNTSSPLHVSLYAVMDGTKQKVHVYCSWRNADTLGELKSVLAANGMELEIPAPVEF